MSHSHAATREHYRQRDGRFGVQPRTDNTDVSLASVNPEWESAQELMNDAYKMAEWAINSHYVRGSAEDLAQEGLVRYYARVKAGPVRKPKALLRQIIRRLAQGDSPLRWEDRAALDQLEKAVDEFTQKEQRQPTGKEYIAMAQGIRDNWHYPKSKPRKAFWLLNKAQFTDSIAALEEVGFELTDEQPPTPGGWKQGEFTEEALAVHEGRGGHYRTAQRLAWNSIAEHADDMPFVQRGQLSHRRATAVRKTVEKSGGALKVAQAWQDGVIDPKTAEAIFAPWPDATSEAKDMIAAKLITHSAYADDLWNSAVMFANNRNLNK